MTIFMFAQPLLAQPIVATVLEKAANFHHRLESGLCFWFIYVSLISEPKPTLALNTADR